MSVIQKIRTKYAKLAGGVIALALVGFILMDALSSRTSNLFGDDNSIAKVNGTKIDYVVYTQRTKDYETLYSNTQQQADENFRAQIDEMALNDLVKETLVEEEAEKLGLTVTEAEKKDMIYGNDPDNGVKSYQPFTNPNTKSFDPQYVKLFEEQADQLDPTGKARLHWETYKSFIMRNALTKKYTALFTATAYAPKFLAMERSKQQASIGSIEYVNVPLDEIKDESVKLEDKDYNDYMNRHKAEFFNKDATRSIQFVVFNVLPTATDTARALGVLNELKEEFTTTADNESFVNRNSEESYADVYKMKTSLKSTYADSVFNQPVGAVLGPVYEGETYKMFKVIDKKSYPDSVTCRHILIQTSANGKVSLSDSVARTRIDSIAAAIKAGASFAEMVQKYSDDAGSKEKGGEYTFSFEQKAGLNKAFGDFIYDNKAGDSKIVKIDSTNQGYQGYHLIEIIRLGEIKPAIKLATISKALFAGDETENEVYAKATEFAGSNSNAADFDKAVKKDNLQLMNGDNVKPSDFIIYGIGPSREVIRWIYKAEVNEVSAVFPGNKKYIVAKLASINQPGMKKLDETMRKNLEGVVKSEKKAKMLVEKYNSKKSLAEIAAAANAQVQRADSFRGNNSFSGSIGYAPKIVGYSFCKELKLNTLSKGIIEQAGVFYIVVRERQSSPVTDTTFMIREREMLQMEAKNGVSGSIGDQLKKNAKIKYNPDNF